VHLFREHRPTGNGGSATTAQKTNFAYPAVVNLRGQLQYIAAHWIAHFHASVGAG
jgi:hypothetical protein